MYLDLAMAESIFLWLIFAGLEIPVVVHGLSPPVGFD